MYWGSASAWLAHVPEPRDHASLLAIAQQNLGAHEHFGGGSIAVTTADLSEPSFTPGAGRPARPGGRARALAQDRVDVVATVVELREHVHDVTNT